MHIAQHHSTFVSYSHKDQKWLDEFETHLKPFLRDGAVYHWSDMQIQPGSQWHEEIALAVAAARVAVLLVTPDFLASDYINDHELTPILANAASEGLTVLWIPVRASAYMESPLQQYQSLGRPELPLAKVAKAQRDEMWVAICQKIAKA